MPSKSMSRKNHSSSTNSNGRSSNGPMYSNHSSYTSPMLRSICSHETHFRYEQSRVYQYLKRSDLAYTTLAQRKETLFDAQKIAYQEYRMRRQQLFNKTNLQASIVSVATYSIGRRAQLIKIERMKNELMELESKHRYLLESKIDKIKAWESVYTQPMKRDLMDFCLQTNMDQVLTLSCNQLQQETLSQPMTPVLAPASLAVIASLVAADCMKASTLDPYSIVDKNPSGLVSSVVYRHFPTL